MKSKNPYIAGPVVDVPNFIGRQREINSILSSTENRLSVCVIGDPHIGKSSLLHYIRNNQNLNSAGKNAYILRDGLSLETQSSHIKFWQSIFAEVSSKIESKSLKRTINSKIKMISKSTDYIRHILEKLCEHDINLVLILDELDALVANPNFSDISFWGQFRYLASTRLFCFLGASRKDLYTINSALNKSLNNKLQGLRDFGSPIFNFAESIYLKNFSNPEVDILFEKASAHTHFSPLDTKIIKNLSGGHPYIIQKACSLLWDQKNQQDFENYQDFVETLLEATDNHFRDTWNQLEEYSGSRTLVVLITLRELGRKTHDLSTLDNDINIFYQAGKPLERAGFLTKNEQGYQITGSLFAFWIQRNILSSPPEDFEKHLTEKERKAFNITKEKQQMIITAMTKMYQETKAAAIDVGSAFIKNQLGI